MIDQDTRDLALRTFREILQDPDAKAADRLRAAEAVSRMEQEQKEAGLSDALDASDEELLKRARGEQVNTRNDDLERFAAGE